MNNRQSTFDRQLDSGHLGRFGSQVGYFEINVGDSKIKRNGVMLNGGSKSRRNTIATLWKVTNVLDKSRRLCLRSWSLQVLRLGSQCHVSAGLFYPLSSWLSKLYSLLFSLVLLNCRGKNGAGHFLPKDTYSPKRPKQEEKKHDWQINSHKDQGYKRPLNNLFREVNCDGFQLCVASS